MIRCAAIDFNNEFHFEILRGVTTHFEFGESFLLHGFEARDYPEPVQNLIEDFEFHLASHDLMRIQYIEHLSRTVATERSIIGLPDEDREMFFMLCDRAALFGMDRIQKQSVLQMLHDYFTYVINTCDFNLVLTLETPHSFYSFLLYRMLVLKGVPVLRLEGHFLEGYSLVLGADFPVEYPSEVPTGVKDTELSSALDRALNGTNKHFQQWTQRERERAPGQSTQQRRKLRRQYQRQKLANLVRGILPMFFQKHHHGIASLNPPMGDFNFRWRMNRLLVKQEELLYYALDRSHLPELSKPYVYFALHMQPEKTSLPLAGRFARQQEAVKVLSEVLPPDWIIYVKEHPNQFNPAFPSNYLFRNREFYDALQSSNRVVLVPPDFSSQELVAHSKVVATLTGSVGWEALRAGKPVITFGEAYYNPCRSAYYCTSVHDCRLAFVKIQEAMPATVRRNFLDHVHILHQGNVLIPAAASLKEAERSGRNVQQDIDIIVSVLIQKIKNLGFQSIST
ncbi:MAG: hypothetical protein KTR24_04765 [Saprospiraceae bacterium]|nr:hypothetical protein [Saprospiraceae bacterium]